MRRLALFVLILLAAPAAAQPPVATSDQSFAWNFPDTDVAAGGPVTRFELQIDSGGWSDVGMTLVPSSPEKYFAPIPSGTTGVHTGEVRACNDKNLCGGPLTFTYDLGVVPATIQGPVEIIDTPTPTP